MLKDIFNPKKKSPVTPVKEKHSKSVPSKRFNDMIDYYTTELKSRIKEVEQLKEENEMLIKTSLKSASRSDELRLHLQKVQEDYRVLQQKLKENK